MVPSIKRGARSCCVRRTSCSPKTCQSSLDYSRSTRRFLSLLQSKYMITCGPLRYGLVSFRQRFAGEDLTSRCGLLNRGDGHHELHPSSALHGDTFPSSAEQLKGPSMKKALRHQGNRRSELDIDDHA